ncbi:MAG: hypothetical protein EOO18_03490 [Chryseobacterium sp.]|jgi:hypothetical protein|nr:MAG: hypothetical protein EOO18_03490 [Chryseobacterium sp.]
MIIPYFPEDIKNFFVYDYEWIDELFFLKRIDEILDSYESYESELKKKFIDRGWSGEGEVNNVWIPPFAMSGIIKYGEDGFLKKYYDSSLVGNLEKSPKSWTRGLLLWHVKQKDDGISFICSPLELNIPGYGLS